MAKRTKSTGQFDGLDAVRLADIVVYIDICKILDDSGSAPEPLTNFSTLLKAHEDQLGPQSTAVGQVRRIVRFLTGGDSEDIELVFEKVGGILRPTELGRQTRSKFEILKGLYENIRSQPTEFGVESAPIVRIGAPQTIGIRVISSIFSYWRCRPTLEDIARIEVTIGNSQDLLPSLAAGKVDLVVAYGSESEQIRVSSGSKGPQASRSSMNVLRDIASNSLKYESRMVLLSHPLRPLWITQPAKGAGMRVKAMESVDINKGYWDKVFHPDLTDRPDFSELRPVRLEQIDFGRMDRLIVARSWDQPRSLSDFLLGLAMDRILMVSSYDEALAHVRMGHGLALASEIFAKRKRITAFKLEPWASYKRSIRLYYRPDGINDAVAKVGIFLQGYIDRFGDQIRSGGPPAIGCREYEAFCREFEKKRDLSSENRSWFRTSGND